MLADNETVVFVEFDTDGHPATVYTHDAHEYGVTEHDYRFDYSKKYGLMFHYAGMGPAKPIELYQTVSCNEDGTYTDAEFAYWAEPGIEVKEAQLCKRLEALPDEYTVGKLFDHSQHIECDRVVWCSECDDCFPDKVEDYCEHVWWCDICEDTSTPDERCGHAEGAEA